VLLATLTPVAIGLLTQSASPPLPIERETPKPGQESAADTPEGQAPPTSPEPGAAPPETPAAPSSDAPPAQAVPQAPEATLQEQSAAAQPEPAKQAEPPEQTEPAEATVTPDLQEDLDWLKRQDEGRFTVQLVAARDLATSRAFAVSHSLEGIHFIQTRSYVIGLFGSFPSREQAARVLPDLPQAVRENGPWIRTIGSIRETLP
jgi:DamX protein